MDEDLSRRTREGLNLEENSPSTSSPEERPSGLKHRCFSEKANDMVIHFQILDMGRQLYIWLASGSLAQDHLHASIPVPQSPIPAVTALIKGSGDAEGASLAQRLARKLGRPVLVSCNLPTGIPIIYALAEKRLLVEIQHMRSPEEGEATA